MKHLRRFSIFIVCLLLVINIFPLGAVAATDYEGNATKAQGIALMDADSGRLLVDISSDVQIYPASTTKIMTCLLGLELGNLDDTVTIGDNPVKLVYDGSSNMGLIKGEQLTLRQLLYGAMLPLSLIHI